MRSPRPTAVASSTASSPFRRHRPRRHRLWPRLRPLRLPRPQPPIPGRLRASTTPRTRDRWPPPRRRPVRPTRSRPPRPLRPLRPPGAASSPGTSRRTRAALCYGWKARSSGRAPRRHDRSRRPPETSAPMKNLNIAAMMKQAQAMQARMQEVQDEVAQQSVEASAGGGMVTVTANGKGEVQSVKIDPKLLEDGDVEMLEDLVLAAVNEAHRRADEMMKSALSRIAGPLGGGLPF